MSTDGATPSISSTPNSAPSSPRNRPKKILCSYGGKILPRPSDGLLKYVGGETRVVSVPRDITFQELMKKLTSMVNGEMVLKYQVLSEDLDALVSVKSDEDLRHMFEEIDRYESARSARLRAFLFPPNPVVIGNPSVEPHVPEQQRYIDSINGIIRQAPTHIKQHPTISTMQCGSLASSACSSPRSPDSYTAEGMNGELLLQGNHHKVGAGGMHRVRSSPSISSLSNQMHQTSSSSHNVPPPYHHNYRQGQGPSFLSGSQSLKPPIDAHKIPMLDRPFPGRSLGRGEGIKYQAELGPPQHYYAFRQNRGNGAYQKWVPYDDYNHFTDRRIADRPRSHAGSPTSLSPRYGQSEVKAWDSMSIPGREM